MTPDKSLLPYLSASEIIDWHNPEIVALAGDLRRSLTNDASVSKAMFEWVRDEIKHTVDHNLQPVTSTASEVLRLRTGFCYAKSHLLAALLRACGIPTGFCYQRLSIDDHEPVFCLHGFNAIHLRDYGWYRVDARGNNNKIQAVFTPPTEVLAFQPTLTGEQTFREVLAEPLSTVVTALKTYQTCADLCNHLPDAENLGA